MFYWSWCLGHGQYSSTKDSIHLPLLSLNRLAFLILPSLTFYNVPQSTIFSCRLQIMRYSLKKYQCFTILNKYLQYPLFQLNCGHKYHLHCVKRILENKWVGPRITFNFILCPMCKVCNVHNIMISS
jgi:hypothetical protein